MSKLLHKKYYGVAVIVLLIVVALSIVPAKSIVNTKVKNKAEDKVTYSACKDNNISSGQSSSTLPVDENGLIGFDSDIIEQYNITNDIDGNNIVISVAATDPNSTKQTELRKAVFTLDKINGKDAPSGKTVSYGHNLTLDLSTIGSSYKLSNSKDLTLNFTSKNVLITYNGENCYASVRFEVIVEGAFDTAITDATIVSSLADEPWANELNNEEVVITDHSSEIDTLDCNNPSTIKTDFDREFCNNQTAVVPGQELENKGRISKRKIDSNGTYTGDTISMSCDYRKISNLGIDAGNSYYNKKTVFTATKTINKKLDKSYQYRFAPGNYYQDTSKFNCKIKCTENVSVEYGPPVAVKAGVCFEYQVKATSYVNCGVVELPSPPKQYSKFCSPRPRCVHHRKNGKDVTKDRAGPSETFDNCVIACDGGKYTDECTQECYNKIYKGNGANNMLSYTNRFSVRKLATYAAVNDTLKSQINEINNITKKYSYGLHNYNEKKGPDIYYGSYYWGTDGKIHWAGDEKLSPSIYYKIEDPKRDYSPYTVVGDGFIRLVYSDGDVCGADCHYSTKTCKQNRDRANLTPAQIFASNQYLNIGVAAADNRINNDTYEEAVKECKAKAICSTHTATFSISVNSTTPITGGSDTLTFTDQKITNGGKSRTEVLNDARYLKGFDGCYKNGDTKNIWYQAIWGFPGACVSQKYGTLNNNGTRACGDDFRENQYCLPFNIGKTNQKWWRYYYTKLFGSGTGAETSLQSEAFLAKYGTSWEVHNISDFTPNWNITASARQFGFFRWNIDVNCFYGYDDFEPDDGKDEKYIRAVDLNNLFPDTGGAILNDSTNVGRGNAPLNWSKYATNTKKDTTGLFDSKPNEYLQWVQKKGYAIYNNENLDYQVTLNPTNINTIKGMANGYGTFLGEMRAGGTTSVSNYKSSLLRTTLSGNVILPNDTALQCNNMVNRNACEDFS